jgi:hypothetical protein
VQHRAASKEKVAAEINGHDEGTNVGSEISRNNNKQPSAPRE